MDIDLCGSLYDTKIYVYDEAHQILACNDDDDTGEPCGEYVSKIEHLVLPAGGHFYVVVDGYGGDSGDYLIEITEYAPCELDCPGGAEFEGEPYPYDTHYNGGCNASQVNPPLQPITGPVFCGVAGWSYDTRDTDWFTLQMPASGVLEIVGNAEFATYMFELGPQNCDAVGVLQLVEIGPCAAGTLTIVGEPGSQVWFFVGSTTIQSPDWLPDIAVYDYVLWTNLDVVATETRSLGEVKALFD